MTRSTQSLLSLCMVFGLSLTVTGDTLYLDDGSVLTGVIIQETTTDCVIANNRYGDLVVLKSHILYQETDTPIDRVETFTITRDASTVISRVTRPVPDLAEGSTRFKLMIPGEVKAACDGKGLEIPLSNRLIGSNSLITINTQDLAPDTTSLIVTSLQDDMIKTTASGHLAFKSLYVPNQALTLRVVLKFPKGFTLQTIQPEPQLHVDGLIVWEQALRRQQKFAPSITFTP